MPKIRTVKPSFFMSRAVKKLTDKQKLVWQGLWPNADDEGRLLDEPGILIGQLWALSLTESRLDSILGELHDAGRIIRYVIAGEGFIQVTNWEEHQKIGRPVKSLLPPVGANAVVRPRQGVNTAVTLPGHGRKGKEQTEGGEGSTNSATPHCSRHPEGTDSPCQACKLARLRFDKLVAQSVLTVSGIVTPKACKTHGMPDCEYCREAVAS